MGTLYNILLVLGFIVATIFALIVLFTGKGDAMSGGGSVRTTFKGKASFDDIMSRIAFGFGIGFMAITLTLNAIASRYPDQIGETATVNTPVEPLKGTVPPVNTPTEETPKSGTPANEEKKSTP